MASKKHQTDKNSFVQHCIDTITGVNFADAESAQVFASFKNGKLQFCDRAVLEAQVQANDLKEVILGTDAHQADELSDRENRDDLLEEKKLTLGRWRDEVPAN